MPATARSRRALSYRAAQFEFSQGVQQLGRGDLTDRTVAEGSIGRFEEPTVLAERDLRAALAALLVQKLLGNLTEGVAAVLFGLTSFARHTSFSPARHETAR
jgi:hypothetical protein